MNIGHDGMKRLMEEATVHHKEAVHYSTLARIRVGSDSGSKKGKDSEFSPSVLSNTLSIDVSNSDKRLRVYSVAWRVQTVARHA